MPGTIPDSGDSLADAKALGCGLMRGDRSSLRLGYSWENATKAVVERYDLTHADKIEVACYLRGFAIGMAGTNTIAARLAFAAGIEYGQGEGPNAYPSERDGDT